MTVFWLCQNEEVLLKEECHGQIWQLTEFKKKYAMSETSKGLWQSRQEKTGLST